MEVNQNHQKPINKNSKEPLIRGNQAIYGKVLQATVPQQGVIYSNSFQSLYYPVNNQKLYPYIQGVKQASNEQKTENKGYKEIATFDVPYIGKGKLYLLDNGQHVVIAPKKGQTAIKSFVKVGSFNEKKNRGISHYIEHNLFNGSKGLDPNQFVEEVIGKGGHYNASTDTSDTDYYIKSPLHKEGDLEKFLTMHANMLLYPDFSEKMLEKEKGPVISEIQMYEDDPADEAYNTMLKNLFGIKADYQGLIAGSSKIIKNLKRDDVVNYYNEWYRPDNMVTVIVGEVDPDETIKLVSKLFNRKKANPQEKNKEHFYEELKVTDKTIRKDIMSPHIDAVQLTMGFAGPKNNDIKDTVNAMALSTALAGYENSRLLKALKPFNSEAYADTESISPNYNDPQLFNVMASFSPGQEEEGLKTIYSTIHKMTQEPISEKELQIIKGKMKDNLTQVSECSMGIADLIGNAIVEHGNLNGYSELVKSIDKLTAKDIQEAAKKYMNLSRVSIVMVHPENEKIEAGKDSGKVGFSGNPEKFKFHHLKELDLLNNLHVLLHDDPTSIRTSASLKIKSDNIKTLKPGVAEILGSIMTKGTKNYSEEELNEIIDSNNLGIYTESDGRTIDMTANCPKEKLPMALGMIKEILYNPDFTEEKFKEAKEELKIQYASMPKDPLNRAFETVYPDYLWGITPRKILQDIDKVSLNDVKKLHRDLISDSHGIITIDGPVSKTPGLYTATFNELQTGMAFSKKFHYDNFPESKPIKENLVIAEPEKRNQADVIQLFKIKESGNIKDHAALLLLNEVLGGNSLSRLFTDLREKQKLAYRVKSQYVTDGKYGNIILQIKTTTEDDLLGHSHENLQKSLDGFKKHIELLKNKKIDEKELETAKLEVKTDISEEQQTSEGRTARLQAGFNSLYGSGYSNRLLDAIDKIKPEDIQNAARLYLGQPSVISLIASPETIKGKKDYLSSLGKLEIIDNKK